MVKVVENARMDSLVLAYPRDIVVFWAYTTMTKRGSSKERLMYTLSIVLVPKSSKRAPHICLRYGACRTRLSAERVSNDWRIHCADFETLGEDSCPRAGVKL